MTEPQKNLGINLNDVSWEDLAAAVKRVCVGPQIRGLLARYQEVHPERIRVSAPTKADLVDANLQDAVTKGLIPVADVIELVRVGEENGNQHIFFWGVTDKEDLEYYRNAPLIAEKLLGQPLDVFQPRFQHIQGQEFWADFRELSEGGWTASFYTYGEKRRTEDATPEDSDKQILEVSTEQVEAVLVVKWNRFDLLEIRVPRWRSREVVDTFLARMKYRVADAVNWSRLQQWDLTAAQDLMLRLRAKEAPDFIVSDTDLAGKRGASRFSALNPGEAVGDDAEWWQTINSFLDQGDKPRQITVTWRIEGEAGESRGVITVIGRKSPNEVVVLKKLNPDALDSIIERLIALDTTAQRQQKRVEHPVDPAQLRETVRRLVAKRRKAGLTAAEIRSQLPTVPSLALVEALRDLVGSGELVERLRIYSPTTNTRVGEEYRSFSELPETFEDRFGCSFELSEAEIQTVFRGRHG